MTHIKPPPTRCKTCNRNPAEINTATYECSHCECPHRHQEPELDHHEPMGGAAYRTRPTNKE